MFEEMEPAAAVHLVRDELLHAAAAATAAHEDWPFAVGPIGMAFTVGSRRDAMAKAGFRAWAVSGETEARIGGPRTRKLSLTLTPKHAGGTSVAISQDAVGRQDGATALFVPASDPS